MISKIPELRLRTVNDGSINAEGEFVLYWMIAVRRTEWNFSLQRAEEWARELRKPLVVFEPLRCGYRWASDRLHQFVIATRDQWIVALFAFRPYLGSSSVRRSYRQ